MVRKVFTLKTATISYFEKANVCSSKDLLEFLTIHVLGGPMGELMKSKISSTYFCLCYYTDQLDEDFAIHSVQHMNAPGVGRKTSKIQIRIVLASSET